MKHQEMLKYFSGTSGAWSVMMSGDTVMPMSSANSLDSKGINYSKYCNLDSILIQS